MSFLDFDETPANSDNRRDLAGAKNLIRGGLVDDRRVQCALGGGSEKYSRRARASSTCIF